MDLCHLPDNMAVQRLGFKNKALMVSGFSRSAGQTGVKAGRRRKLCPAMDL